MSLRIIAEIGENHMGRMDLARRMIQEAAIAGADIVKFQSYFGRDFRDDDPEKAWFTKVELSNERHFELKAFAEANGVEFMSSPFSQERARFLVDELGLKRVKVASGVMLNFPILDYLGASPRVEEVIISTGLSKLSEVRAALDRLRNVPKVTVLHCVTQYPCQDADANLKAIETLRKEFPGLDVGYSDHTLGIEACLAAVALGATVLEKHFTLNKRWIEGTDHILSAEPRELRELVDKAKRVSAMLGQGEKVPNQAELRCVDFVRGRFPS